MRKDSKETRGPTLGCLLLAPSDTRPAMCCLRTACGNPSCLRLGLKPTGFRGKYAIQGLAFRVVIQAFRVVMRRTRMQSATQFEQFVSRVRMCAKTASISFPSSPACVLCVCVCARACACVRAI